MKINLLNIGAKPLMNVPEEIANTCDETLLYVIYYLKNAKIVTGKSKNKEFFEISVDNTTYLFTLTNKDGMNYIHAAKTINEGSITNVEFSDANMIRILFFLKIEKLAVLAEKVNDHLVSNHSIKDISSYINAADSDPDPVIALLTQMGEIILQAKKDNSFAIDLQVRNLENKDLHNITFKENNGLVYFTGKKISVNEIDTTLSTTFTEMEKQMIPVMPDSYIPANWTNILCAQIKLSSRFEKPFRNILLYGPSGSGKSTGTRGMAKKLGLPYVKITCSPDSEIFDFIGELIPNTDKYGDKKTGEVLSSLNLPSFEDIENDFTGSYMKLFGQEPDAYASPSDCYNEVYRRGLESKPGEVNDFLYKESPLIQAVRNGYFCELQEPNIIKRAAVLVGLNALMENSSDGATYTLPTGEIIKRHRNCVIALTTNLDYEGCKKLQQSVFSRIDLVKEVPYPKEEEMMQRVILSTGFKDKEALSKMVSVAKQINVFCDKNDIMDGVCGPRELENWAKLSLLINEMDGITEQTVSD